MKAIIIIPARMASTRFPGKVLAELDGHPMIWHVWNRATQSRLASRVIVATDDQRVCDAVRAFGGEAVMTSPACESGTDRVAEAARGIQADVIVNLQGDEPNIHPEVLDQLIDLFNHEPQVQMATLCVPLNDPELFRQSSVVKVIMDGKGNALYFSRSQIPHNRTKPDEPLDAHKHLGVYAFRPPTLARFVAWPPGRLEQIEKLEQLRALENGLAIRVIETVHDSIGVDTPEELETLKGRVQGSGFRVR